MTREQMDKDHATPRIGGSLAAIITLEAMGKEVPFGGSSFNAWARWKGLKPPRDDTRRFEVGRDMEPALRKWHESRTGRKVLPLDEMVVDPAAPWRTGHLDGIEDSTEADWEGKTAEKYSGWDEEWSDPELGEPNRVPMNYMLQALWYNSLPRPAARLDLKDGVPYRPFIGAHDRPMVLAAQFGLTDPLRIYRWEPTETLKGVAWRMVEECAKWWDNYIVRGNVPPMSSPRDAAVVHPKANGKEMKEGGENVIALAAAYEEAKARENEAKADKEKAAADLCKIIGNDYGILASNQRTSVRVTWAPYHKESYVVKAQDGRSIRVTVKEVK
jgi:hypothetical protein